MINSSIRRKNMTYTTTQTDDKKRCSRCDTEKDITEFAAYPPESKSYKRFKNGIKPWCKECYKVYAREYGREMRPHKGRWDHYKRKYDLTKDEVIGMMEERNGKCDICNKGIDELKTGKTKHSNGLLFIDHCHQTNKVRGMLCFECNVMIGNAHDNIHTLHSAINYLERNK
jgi:hypothetical protein